MPLIDPQFLADLRCPADGGELEESESTLRCRQCGRGYPFDDGIPVLLVEEAIQPEGIQPEGAAA